MEAATSDARVESVIHHGSSPTKRLHDRKHQQHVRQHRPNQVVTVASSAKRHPSKVAPVTSPASLYTHALEDAEPGHYATDEPAGASRIRPDDVVQATLHKWAAMLDSTDNGADHDGAQSENQVDSLSDQFVDPTATELPFRARTAIALDLVSEMMHKMLPSTPGIADAVVHTLVQAIYETYDTHTDWRELSLHVDKPTVPAALPPHRAVPATSISDKVLPAPPSPRNDRPSASPSMHASSRAAPNVLDVASMAQQWNDLVVHRHRTTGALVECVDVLPSDVQRDLARVLASRWTPDSPPLSRSQRLDTTTSTIPNNDDGDDDDDDGDRVGSSDVEGHGWMAPRANAASDGHRGADVVGAPRVHEDHDEDGGSGGDDDDEAAGEVMETLLDVYRLMLINHPRAQRQARHRLQSLLVPVVGDLDDRGGDLSELTGDGADGDLRRLVEQLVEDDPIVLVDLGLT